MKVVSPENKRILVADHESEVRDRVAAVLVKGGYQVAVASTSREAATSAARRPFDAVLLHVESSGPGGTLREFRRDAPGVPVVAMVDPARVEDAVQALRDGADDWVLRPPDAFELRARLERVLEKHDLGSRLALLQDEVSRSAGFKNMVSRSGAMRSAVDRILRVAPMRATVLIYGESGVGKELVARAIHFNSPRRDWPFVAINCAAIPSSLIESELFGHERGSFTGAHARARGKFELAHRGTLFLDEIGEMDTATQAKLLRVLEEREFMRVGGDQSIRVDVRVIAATNANLDRMVEDGLFRRDLYYRLKVVTISVPPLRERRADIPHLVDAFLEELSRANAVRPKRVTPEAMAALESYQWPGNVRELKNILESVLVSSAGDVIGLDDLPPSVVREAARAERRDLAPGTTLADMERELIRRTLEHVGGNRTHAASMLGIGVRTLQRKIREFALDIPSKRRRPRRRVVFGRG